MSWSIAFTPRAKRELGDVPKTDRPAIYRALEQLAIDSPNLDIKKLWLEPPQWRLRVGKWRVIYSKNHETRTLEILNVFDRKKGY